MKEIHETGLMIGNIVTVDNEQYHPKLKGWPLKVTGMQERVISGIIEHCVSLEHINQKPNTYYDTYSQYMKFIRPILITEYIVLKCGFKPLPHSTVTNSMMLDVGRNRFVSIGCVSDCNQMMWLQHIEGNKVTDLVCLHNYDYDGWLHLHKLQNIIKSLTGKDLKVEI